MGQEDINPCITCGACCALFRASFYWAEADDAGGTVPVDLTEQLNAFRRVMKGTNDPSPRCVALVGEIGRQIYCSIYDHRSSVCRDFPVAWENGLPNERCDKARLAWGLPPLLQPTANPAETPDDPTTTMPPSTRPPLPRAA
ncbi:MAG: YkgJ family cysteine cluster protein [Smithella sp.]|nr:YkgJ family cysteine cluster protein [Smithella sp.]